jgi:imidazolonepropionase-like amidohydrolase
MKKLILLFISLILTACSSDPSQDTITVFTNVNVIPMDSEQVLMDQTVIIDGDRIVDVVPSDEITLPPGATIIDGSGKYLMPGLAEMHGHVPPTNPGPNAPDLSRNNDGARHAWI